MKKVISVFLAVLMLLSCASVAAFAEDTTGKAKYTVTLDNADHVWFYFVDANGEAIDSLTFRDYEEGETCYFKASVNFGWSKTALFAVHAGETVLTPDDNEVYSMTVTAATKVQVGTGSVLKANIYVFLKYLFDFIAVILNMFRGTATA